MVYIPVKLNNLFSMYAVVGRGMVHVCMYVYVSERGSPEDPSQSGML